MALKNLRLSLYLTISFSLFGCAANKVQEQETITLENADGQRYDVKILQDFQNNELKFLLGEADSICFDNYTGLADSIQVLGNKFIRVNFSVRGGSGVKFRRYAEVCIVKNRLQVAIDVYSTEESNFSETYSDAATDLSIKNRRNILEISRLREAGSDRIIVHEAFLETLAADSSVITDTATKSELEFNRDLNVFFNSIDTLEGTYSFRYLNGVTQNVEMKKVVSCAIKLVGNEYYFINQKWFIRSQEREMIEFSGNCQ